MKVLAIFCLILLAGSCSSAVNNKQTSDTVENGAETNGNEQDLAAQGCQKALQCYDNLQAQEEICQRLAPAQASKEKKLKRSVLEPIPVRIDECSQVIQNMSQQGQRQKVEKTRRYRTCLEEMLQQGDQQPNSPDMETPESIKQRVKCSFVAPNDLLTVKQFELEKPAAAKPKAVAAKPDVTKCADAKKGKKGEKAKPCVEKEKTAKPVAQEEPKPAAAEQIPSQFDQCEAHVKLMKNQCKSLSKCCPFAKACSLRAKNEAVQQSIDLRLLEKHEECKQRRKLEPKAPKEKASPRKEKKVKKTA